MQNFWINKKVLITGHSGFKGMWLAVILNIFGANVYGLSDFSVKSKIYEKINGKKYLWEPFSDKYSGIYNISRNIYKNTIGNKVIFEEINHDLNICLLYTSPSPRDRQKSRMPSSA